MSTKAAKKIRQMHRREVRKLAEERIFGFRDLINDKPRWCPAWLWRRILRLVIKM